MNISGNPNDDIFQPIHYELDTTNLNMFYFKHILEKWKYAKEPLR